jgi:hypothetical protein
MFMFITNFLGNRLLSLSSLGVLLGLLEIMKMPTSIWVVLKAYASLSNISSLWSITCVAPPTQMPFESLKPFIKAL